MSRILEHDYDLIPVTAISFFAEDHGTFILAGQGPFLSIFCHRSNAIVSRTRIFDSQTIHGIVTEHINARDTGKLMLWGGHSVRLAKFIHVQQPVVGTSSSGISIKFDLGEEIQASDWILSGAFRPTARDGPTDICSSEAVLVTAHNTPIMLRESEHHTMGALIEIPSNTRSLLYSAHAVWQSRGHALIASGTVFGEILVSSCYLQSPGDSDDYKSTKSCLHQILHGHEGSIFGVQISQELSSSGNDTATRFLASCSDDRTIRIWNISAYVTAEMGRFTKSPTDQDQPRDTGFGGDGISASSQRQASAQAVAKSWGHASRIWAVYFVPDLRFNGSANSHLSLLSFGEDASCQLWQLLPSPQVSKSPPGEVMHGWDLSHTRTMNLHSGKNLWTGSVHRSSSEGTLLATGGSDGRIALVVFQNDDDSLLSENTGRQDETWDGMKNKYCPEDANDKSHYEERHGSTSAFRTTGPVDCNQLKELLCLPDRTSRPTTGSTSFEPKGQGAIASHAFKCYTFLNNLGFLAITNHGFVLHGSIISSKPKRGHSQNVHSSGETESGHCIHWTRVTRIASLQAYSVLESCPQEDIYFFAASNGDIYYYFSDSRKALVLTHGGPKVSKILCQSFQAGLIWLIVSRQGSQTIDLALLNLDLLRARGSSAQSCVTSAVELPADFMVTAALITNDLMFLGSRAGAMAVFEIERARNFIAQTFQTSTCIPRAQRSADAITSIIGLPQQNLENASLNYVVTTARDGSYAIHVISKVRSVPGRLSEMNHDMIHRSSPPFGPMIEGARFDASGDLILHGFRSRDFVVWNETRQYELMSVDCGGAHRNWSFCPNHNDDGGGSFLWTRASKLHLHTQPRAQHQVIRNGGHGREIKALAISPVPNKVTLGHSALLCTGAEDTTVRIFSFERRAESLSDNSRRKLECTRTLRAHVTGIQHLQWSECGTYLFSSASYEEFFVWRVRQIPGFGFGVVREAVCPAATESSDLRVMSFATTGLNASIAIGDGSPLRFLITLVYSNSTIRSYIYRAKEKILDILWKRTYSSSCLTQVFHYVLGENLMVITAGTDGHIVIWRGASPLGWGDDAVELGSHAQLSGNEMEIREASVWLRRIKVHQNTVMGMIVVPLADRRASALLVSGGDDNALAFTLARFDADGSVSLSALVIPRAHAAAVTALSDVSEAASPDASRSVDGSHKLRIATSGNDQRLKIWSVSLNLDGLGVDGLEVTKDASLPLSVADVSSMDVTREGTGETRVVIAGVGMEVWKIHGASVEPA
ncbi:MAG: hypothetical protein M1837_002346 [Sclerophora amabilis]|nr:MAG: hypothetical protein M1837_002346 [Sclerophora amabilis]